MDRWSVKKINSAELAIVIYILFTMISGSTADLLTKVARVFLVFVLILSICRSGTILIKKNIRLYIGWTVAFFGYNFLHCFNAFDTSYAWDYTLTLFYVVVCDLLILLYVSCNTETVWLMLKSVIWGAFLKSVYNYGYYGILVFMTSRGTDDTSANSIGFYCAFAVVFCLYFFKKERKYIYFVLGLFNLVFLMLSASRKAILFLIIPIVVIVVLRAKNPLVVIRNIIISIAAVMFVYVLLLKVDFLYELIGNRLEGMVNGLLGIGEADASTSTRMGLIADGITWFKERPIFGYGLSNFKALCAIYRSWGSVYYAHNNYVELLVDCGIIGTVIYYILHLKMLITAFKNKNKFSDLSMVLFGCLCAIVVCDYGMVSYFEVFSQLILLICFITIQMWPEFLEEEEISVKLENYNCKLQ